MMYPSSTLEQTDSMKRFKVLEARRNLRKLEMEAYASAVDVFRAQGVLTEEKLDVLQKLCHHYQIPVERHFAELRRALSDDDLNEIAETLVGYDPTSSWFEEAKKYIDTFKPFIPKSQFTTNAFRAISNLYANALMQPKLRAENNEAKSPERVESREEDKVKVNTDHEYYCNMNPLASRILAESNPGEESLALSRSYLTPVGLEGLTDVFPDPSSDSLDNPPLSPTRDFFLETFTYGNGNRRGTEPNSLPSKRRRTVSEHKSVEESPSFESRRSDKGTPSNTSKIMQDCQLIIGNLRKKGKLPADQQPPAERRRGKGKRVESVAQESPSQVGDGKNISGLIVPCISLERIPMAQPKPSSSPPAKQQKLDRPVMKGGRIKWKKRKLPKTSVSKPTGKKGVTQGATPQSSPAAVKKRRPIRVRPSSSRHSDTAATSPQEGSPPAKKVDTSPSPLNPLAETNTPETLSLATEEPLTPQPQITCHSDDVTIDRPSVESEREKEVVTVDLFPPTDPDLLPHTPNPSPPNTPMEPAQSDIPITPNIHLQIDSPTPCEATPPTLPLPAPPLLEFPLAELLLGRGRKDSSNSLDIPSPDQITSGLQELYSPISSIDTPPDRDRSALAVLVSESTPLSDQLIPRPLFSPITSPEESFSQSPVKSCSATSEKLSLVPQTPHADVLTNRCSLALSDIVDEVCDSISEPLSHPSAEESKPFTPSTDTVFADSSFMLSIALNSFITRVISDEEAPPDGGAERAPPPQTPSPHNLKDVPTEPAFPPVGSLDTAQTLLSPPEVSAPSPEPPPKQ